MSRSFDVFGAWPEILSVVNKIQACSAANCGMPEQMVGALRKEPLRVKTSSVGCWPSGGNAPDDPPASYRYLRAVGLLYYRVGGGNEWIGPFVDQLVRPNPTVSRAFHFGRRTIAATVRAKVVARPANLADGEAAARRANVRPWSSFDLA